MKLKKPEQALGRKFHPDVVGKWFVGVEGDYFTHLNHSGKLQCGCGNSIDGWTGYFDTEIDALAAITIYEQSDCSV